VGGAGCSAGVVGEGWMRVAGAWVSAGVFGLGARLVGGAGCSAGVVGEGWMRVAGAWVSAGVFGVGAGLVGGAGCSAVGVGMAVGEGSVLGTSGVLGIGAGLVGVEGRATPGVGVVGAGVLLRSGRASTRPRPRARSSAPSSSAPTGSALRRRWMPGAGTDDPSRGAGEGATGPSRGTGGGGAFRTVVTPVVGGVSSRNQVETSAAVGRWSGSSAVIACSRAGIGVGRSWGDVGLAVQAGEGGFHGLAGVFPLPGEALDEHQAERVNVGCGPDGVPADLFGGQVGGGPDHQSGVGDLGGIGHRGDAEVAQVRAVVFIEEHVGGFDVAVDHTVCVDVGQGVGQVDTQLRGLRSGQRVLPKPVSQGAPGHQLHHEERASVLLAGVVEGHQTGVAQPGEGSDLAVLAARVGGGYPAQEEFDRDRPAQHLIVRPVHLCCTPTPEQRPHQVPAGDQHRQPSPGRRVHRTLYYHHPRPSIAPTTVIVTNPSSVTDLDDPSTLAAVIHDYGHPQASVAARHADMFYGTALRQGIVVCVIATADAGGSTG